MTELLDDDENKASESAFTSKALNTILLILPFVIILFTIWHVRNDTVHAVSPWLPEYMPWYANGTLINFTVIQNFGVLPALAFRFTKHYKLSSTCIIVFIVAAFLFRNILNFYPHVFKLLH